MFLQLFLDDDVCLPFFLRFGCMTLVNFLVEVVIEMVVYCSVKLGFLHDLCDSVQRLFAFACWLLRHALLFGWLCCAHF